jgi:hypothetical protein
MMEYVAETGQVIDTQFRAGNEVNSLYKFTRFFFSCLVLEF